ncbi:putative polyketide synthase protein [Botrytis fragariae]|uniref:Putative polyketide synthase protein n=1 Tax=Botrytis fragariae TaxID=1964551 RepID=A0A8H6AIB5_9HELO|nr:putative polyketide synthase protein [Botrytis fragariae]KAF5867859.1 putative polyketide synthase protein [Botrytis fragariae]
MNTNGGYFLEEDVRQFDNGFFGINNLEAASMDPQQRKLLEVVYECIENAGVSQETISGTNVGVYVGNFTVDHIMTQQRDLDGIHRYSAVGCGTTLLANRISHVFDLKGPSFTLDTACSSSMYCLHMAINGIKNGDCDSAIVASANLITSPEQTLATSKAGVISPTSTCHTFDASADGYGRAEGVNALYIKQMSSALKAQDNIIAIIKGTAVNANGRTPGLTQPSSDLQEVVIRKAYSRAELDMCDTDYFECHGTGTPVGDPIEVNAIGRCFAGRQGSPLLIGSVKTNLGHSEAASGLTSVIKVAMSLSRGKILPTHGLKTLNPELKLKELNFKVATEVHEWPRSLRRASVNSFGYGGANAHAIIEAVDASIYDSTGQYVNDNNLHDPLFLMPISAASSVSLNARIHHVSKFIKTREADLIPSLAYTLAERRTHFNNRQYLIADRSKDKISAQESAQRIVESAIEDGLHDGNQPPFGFVFSGQGSQYTNMAKGLLEYNVTFRASIRHLDQVIHSLPKGQAPGWTLEQLIMDPPDRSRVDEVECSQPLCTAIQIALVDMLESWNVRPSSVIGHSSGEIAAAYAAGFIDATEAILIAYFRGYAVSQLTTSGAMMAASISVISATELIRETGLSGEVCVACVNAPESVTLSGTKSGIELLTTKIKQQNKLARLLRTSGCAYHSFMMKEVGEVYERFIESVFKTHPMQTCSLRKMYSSVGYDDESLDILSHRQSVANAKYWRSNLEKPVQFHSALTTMVTDTTLHLLEVGPHSVLKGPIQQTRAQLGLKYQNLLYTHTLERNADANLRIKCLAGSLFIRGYPLNWSNINQIPIQYQRPIQDLTPYQWDYSAGLVWEESRLNRESRNRNYPRHELLGSIQPGGHPNEWRWQNTLHINEVLWLSHHKVEAQIVFPAAAYFVMIVEAMTQIASTAQDDKSEGFEFRNVSINTALVVAETNATIELTELQTTVVPRRISTASVSGDWYDFSIASWKADKTDTHCIGSIRRIGLDRARYTVEIPGVHHSTQQDVSNYYDKYWTTGLCFGPHFRSVSNIHASKVTDSAEAVGTVRLLPPVANHVSQKYQIHPITLDACFQLAIMSTAAGNPENLKAYLPVFFPECQIFPVKFEDYQSEGVIHAMSTKSGASTQRIDSTLFNPKKLPIVQVKNAKIALFHGSGAKKSRELFASPKRYPCLRVQWKPDIQRLSTNTQKQFNDYVAQYVREKSLELVSSNQFDTISAVLDMIGHKNPRMHVLVLGEFTKFEKHWKGLLGDGTAFPRFRVWDIYSWDDDEKYSIDNADVHAGFYDVIILPMIKGQLVLNLECLLREYGTIITSKDMMGPDPLCQTSLRVTEVGEITLLSKPPITRELRGRYAIILLHEPSPELVDFANRLSKHLLQHIYLDDARITLFEEIGPNIDPETICISLVELERSYLVNMTQEDLNRLHLITETMRTHFWITGAGNLDGRDPNLSLCSGLSRSLMLEQPSMRIAVIDIGPLNCADNLSTLQAIANIIGLADLMDDQEFLLREGLLYVSRFVPEPGLNSVFQSRIRDGHSTFNSTLQMSKPVQLVVGEPGVADSIHFKEVREQRKETPDGFVDVELKAVSLNAKDVYVLRGRMETQRGTTAMEFSGIVTSIGPNVDHLKIGDRVVAIAPIHFSTTERIPAWAAQKIQEGEQYETMVGLPIVYCTALYALYDRASLRLGESILIHSGAGALGIAAITIALRIGATVYTTVSSQAKRDFLMKKFPIPASHIFDSRSVSFAVGIREITDGKGVNVVLNSLTGDLMHASWRCIADFGRFVEVGKKELLDAGRLDMDGFLRNATFTAFDLSELYYHHEQFYRDKLAKKFTEVLDLFRDGSIEALPTTVFGVTDIAQAINFFSAKDRIGKIVISMEDESSTISVAPAEYSTVFDQENIYLLVGCLGGLGRSLTKWMLSRGARHFVFLGRSGSDKPEATKLIQTIRANGASAIVLKGDVSKASDVIKFVEAGRSSGKRIGGLVQASMGLKESIFSKMTGEAWQEAVLPKVKGTWNLQSAIEDLDLDFFLIFSSVSGSIGTATESNYCAANAFLDSFTRRCRANGKPATSIGLGNIAEVGYLHENPEIEALLNRRGIQPLTQKEFLHIVDFALGGAATTLIHSQNDPHMSSLILTGLESARVQELMEQGFEVTHNVIDDPRASVLSIGFELHKLSQGSRNLDREAIESTESSVEWLNHVPADIKMAFKSVTEAPSLPSAILQLIQKRFSNLMLLPVERVDTDRTLAMYGVDSMIASEFRSWFWVTFRIDVPFFDLLGSGKSLKALADFVAAEMTAL